MSFFSDASGVNITGGTFYSAARDVNIQNDLQLAMQDTSQTLICVGAPVHGRDGFQTGIEDRPLSGLENNRRYAPDTERLPSHDWSTSPGLPPLDSYPRGGLFPVTSASAHSQTPVRRPYDETGRVSQAHEGPPTSPAHPLSNGLYSVPGNIMNTPPTTICAPPGPHGAGTNIHGGTFVGGNVNNIHRNGETGIGILHRAVALAALHDSAESYPQPRCHPETRKDLLEQLWTWCTDSSVESPILWLHGPAGAGKSAVMVTLSNRLQDAQQLGGTFFFKRGHPTRGNANVLFSTIALQLAVNIPELKLPIARVVEENPSLVARSMNMQLRQLLIEPCLTLEFHPIPTILIDGLDECEGKDIQQNILHLLRDSPTPACLPFRMIIASRPEPHIRELLELSSFRGQYRPFNIEQSYRDVCAYLESEFARIHREHSTLAATPYPWPAPEVIDRLVEKSSGYFIYASTIIKFIDDKHYRPTRRLAAIEGLSGVHSPSPFAALDALYRQILLEIPENPDLVPILRVIHHFHLRPDQIEELLGLESGDVQLALRGLYSVIDSTASHPFLNSGPGFIHASFADFLQDPLRAGDFCTSDAVGLNDLARLILSEFAYKHEHPEKNQTYPLAFSLGYELGSLLEKVAPSDVLVHLLRAINLDFVIENVPDVDVLSSWVQRVEPPPSELVGIWEDYKFLDTIVCTSTLGYLGLNENLFQSLSEQQSARLMDELAENSLLQRIVHADLWSDNNYIGVGQLHHLLDVSWGELCAAICRLRPIFGEHPPELHELSQFINDSTINPPTWRSTISVDLAFGCIRVRRLIEAGNLNKYVWDWHTPWGRFIRGSPCSAELLSGVKEYVPPEIPEVWNELHQEEECHDVIQWLKSFPEPPLDEISRWGIFFHKEQRMSYQSSPGYRPPDDYDERWRKFNAKYPE